MWFRTHWDVCNRWASKNKKIVLMAAVFVISLLWSMAGAFFDTDIGSRYFYISGAVLILFIADMVPNIFFLREQFVTSQIITNDEIKDSVSGLQAKEKYAKFGKDFSYRIARMLNRDLEIQREKNWWAYMDFMSRLVFLLVSLLFGSFVMLTIGGSVWGRWYGVWEFIEVLGVISVGGILVLKLLYFEALSFKKVADDLIDRRLSPSL